MRRHRHAAILRLIDDRPVETQAELLALLQQEGFDVTQATVSRDIAQLGLIKIRSAGGRPRYARPATVDVEPQDALERTRRAFRDYVLDMESTGHLIFLRTLSGRANAVAAALDEWQPPGVLGTLAGDDAVLIVVRSAEADGPPPEVADVMRRLQDLRG